MRRLSCVVIILLISSICLSSFAAEKISDDEIYDRVRLMLVGNRNIDGAALKVEVKDGVVTLQGEVINNKQKKKAGKLAKKVKGVEKIINELTLTPK